MNTAKKYLSDYVNQPLSELYKKYDIIIAFSPDQFKEQRKADIEYIHIGAGMICPKGNQDAFVGELEELYYNAICQDVAENGAVSIIKREFANYECSYTGDIDDLTEYLSKYEEIFPKLFTPELVNSTINQLFKEDF